jgi:glycosyltransferase involved in cell wall biosynthesis
MPDVQPLQRDVRSTEQPAPPLVSIVVPFFNEETSLPILLDRIQATTEPLRSRYEFEFIFVDDGSQDDSLSVAKDLVKREPRLKVVELRRNYGQTSALQAAFDAASGEIIISMDADLQHFPEEIPKFIGGIEAGNDVVCGWRHDRREGILRRLPSRVANLFIRRVSGLTIHDIGTTYRAYRSEIVRDIQLLGESHRFVPVFAAVVGARIAEVPIENIERPHGKSNYGLARTLNVLIDLVFLFFFVKYLDRPLRIFGRIALAMFLAGFVIEGALLWKFIRTATPVVRDHSGWFILGGALITSALQVVLFGVLSEMLARLYYAGLGKTHYKIRNVWTERSPARAGKRR